MYKNGGNCIDLVANIPFVANNFLEMGILCLYRLLVRMEKVQLQYHSIPRLVYSEAGSSK